MGRILISAISCNASIGSEALVGFKVVEALAQRHDVTLISAKPSEPPGGVEVYELDIGACSFNDVPPSALMKFELQQRWLVGKLQRRTKFDVVHRVTPSALGTPSLLPDLGCPLVMGPLIAAEAPPAAFQTMLRRPVSGSLEPRWSPGRLGRGLAGRIVGRWAEKDTHLQRAHRILLGNKAAMKRIPEPLAARCRQITYSGIEHDRFIPPVSSRGRSGPLRLLSVGRIIPYKGVELLLRSVAKAAESTDLLLRIVGGEDRVYGAWCRDLAAELGLDGKVTFEAPRPRMNLPALYQEADVFCFTTLCDTYGIALLEAMSSGCAVVVSDVAGAGQIVNGRNGIKIPLTDPELYAADFASAISRLAHDSDLRFSLGQEARRHVVEHHDWTQIGSQLCSVYDDMQID